MKFIIFSTFDKWKSEIIIIFLFGYFFILSLFKYFWIIGNNNVPFEGFNLSMYDFISILLLLSNLIYWANICSSVLNAITEIIVLSDREVINYLAVSLSNPNF